jgi:hypothetical protein
MISHSYRNCESGTVSALGEVETNEQGPQAGLRGHGKGERARKRRGQWPREYRPQRL